MNPSPNPHTPSEPSAPAAPESDSKIRRGKRVRATVAVVAILLVGFIVVRIFTASGGAKKAGAPSLPVATAIVKLGDISIYINALGTVTPVYTVTVTSRVAGELTEIHYTEGQLVKKGDLLAVIDPRPYQAALMQAQGQLSRDKALLKNAYLDLSRYQEAFGRHAIPEQTLATQRSVVEQDGGIVMLDQGNLDAARVNLDYTRITAPISGRVGLRLMDLGNIVQANGSAALVTITQLQPITVIFTIAEDYIADVVKQMQGQKRLSVDALDREQQRVIAHGELLSLDNAIDPTTGTVKARAIFANASTELFPNQFVNAKLLVRTLQKVPLIPSAAVQRNADESYVYTILPDGTVQSKSIKILATDAEVTAVTGLDVGTTLVADGFDRIQNGVKVTVKKPSSTE